MPWASMMGVRLLVLKTVRCRGNELQDFQAKLLQHPSKSIYKVFACSFPSPHTDFSVGFVSELLGNRGQNETGLSPLLDHQCLPNFSLHAVGPMLSLTRNNHS